MEKNNISQMEAQASKKTKGAKVSKTPAIWATLNRARRMFHQQLVATQNNSTKIACIHEVANEVYKKDSYMVWYDLVNESKRLTNLIDFNKYCHSLRRNPDYVAQHVTFEGSSVVNKVMRYGVETILGERILAYDEPLFNPEKISELRYGTEFTTEKTVEEPKPTQTEGAVAVIEELPSEKQADETPVLPEISTAEEPVETEVDSVGETAA